MKTKILKIKVGEVFLNGKSEPVFQTAFQKTSKLGKSYYEIRSPVFVQEITKKEQTPVKEEHIDA